VSRRNYDAGNVLEASAILKSSQDVIVDFDDTLVATYRVRVHTLIRTAAKLGRSITEAEVSANWGSPFPELISALMPNVAFDEFFSLYTNEMLVDHPIALAGAFRLLNYCRGNLKTIIIHSSSRTDLVQQDLVALGWSSHVDQVFGIDRTIYSKPDPLSMCAPLGWLRGRGRNANAAVYIGDSPNDSLLASRCQLPFIGVLTGLVTDLDAYESAALLVNDLDALLDALQ
jgi:phosphoglycolate phosphatase-like HAD superfamily hydrolase